MNILETTPELGVKGEFFRKATFKGPLYGVVVEEAFMGPSGSLYPLVSMLDPATGKPSGTKVEYKRHIDGEDMTAISEDEVPFGVHLDG